MLSDSFAGPANRAALVAERDADLADAEKWGRAPRAVSRSIASDNGHHCSRAGLQMSRKAIHLRPPVLSYLHRLGFHVDEGRRRLQLVRVLSPAHPPMFGDFLAFLLEKTRSW